MSDRLKLIGLFCVMLIITLIVWAGAFALEGVLLPPISAALGWDWVLNIPLTLFFVTALIALPAKWTAFPIKHRITGTTEIDAPISKVWDMLAPRTGDDYWTSSVTQTVRHEDDPSRIDFYFEGAETVGAPPILECVITAEDPERYYAYHALNGDQFPMFAGDVIISEFHLEDLGGRTRVTESETLDRVRWVAVPLLLWLNPCRDSLVRMKAIAEGREDPSWMGRTAAKQRAAAEDQTMSHYTFFKWCALAMIPLAFTLAMISFIGSATAP